MEDFNASAKHKKDITEDKLVEGETLAMREERRHCQKNVIQDQRRLMRQMATLIARQREQAMAHLRED